MGSPELLTPGGLRRRVPGARPGLVAVAMVLATTWLCTAAAMAGWSLLPVLGGWRPFVIVSGSMAPRIKPGDVVCVDPGALARLHRGQIVVVHDPVRPGRLLAHRVQDIRPDGSLVTKGDANPVPDSTRVPAGGAVGVVRLVVPSIGRLALLRTQPGPDGLGLTAITALAAVLLAVGRPAEPVQSTPAGRLRWYRTLQNGLGHARLSPPRPRPATSTPTLRSPGPGSVHPGSSGSGPARPLRRVRRAPSRPVRRVAAVPTPWGPAVRPVVRPAAPGRRRAARAR